MTTRGGPLGSCPLETTCGSAWHVQLLALLLRSTLLPVLLLRGCTAAAGGRRHGLPPLPCAKNAVAPTPLPAGACGEAAQGPHRGGTGAQGALDMYLKQWSRGGGLIQRRAMARVAPEHRWQLELLLGGPRRGCPAALHSQGADGTPADMSAVLPRRLPFHQANRRRLSCPCRLSSAGPSVPTACCAACLLCCPPLSPCQAAPPGLVILAGAGVQLCGPAPAACH